MIYDKDGKAFISNSYMRQISKYAKVQHDDMAIKIIQDLLNEKLEAITTPTYMQMIVCTDNICEALEGEHHIAPEFIRKVRDALYQYSRITTGHGMSKPPGDTPEPNM